MSKNYKPIWIACPESMKDDILNVFERSCPNHVHGLEEHGDVGCLPERNCREHWLEFIDFMDDGEEEEGDGSAD